MNKKIYLSMALVAMFMTSCSVNDSISDDNNDIPEVAYNTTNLFGTRESAGSAFDARSTDSRTVTNLQDWKVEWNDGSTRLFGTPATTGLNLDVDRIAFLATTGGSDWAFLQSDLNRQVFQWSRWSDERHEDWDPIHNSDLANGRCCAEFTTCQRSGGVE